MMVEMAHQPPNVGNLMNEGITLEIDQFRHRIPNCPIGQRPVMIGRSKPTYKTIDKMMNQLNRVMQALEAMGHIVVVNVH